MPLDECSIAPSRRRLLSTGTGLLLTAVAPATRAADWPSKPVRVVSPSTSGITDTHARIVFEILSERLGVRFYIDAKPGAGGGISAQVAAQSPPDGYTLLFCIGSLVVTNPFVYERPLYDIGRDFDPVSMLARTPFAMLVRAGLPARSMAELTEYIRAHPGRTTIANASPGSLAHLISERYLRKIGGTAELVPYRGTPQALLALSAGEVDAFFAPMGEAKAAIAGGKIRGLAVTTAARLNILPDVPTMGEQGIDDFDIVGWYGVLAPKGTPRPIVERLNHEFAAIMASPAYRARIEALGAVPPTAMTPEEFREFYSREAAEFAPLIRALDLKLD
jgi:tripartite-type tricarboxylate transporter receptor subunit TctC